MKSSEYLMPNSSRARAKAKLIDAYKNHGAEISILMGNFHLRHLARIYREFEGDLAKVIVLGEIGHHNVNHCYSGHGNACRVNRGKLNNPDVWRDLRPCNAFSLSVATGIPRETVRRKINELVSKGWLQRGTRGEVCMTQAMVRHFHSGFDIDSLGEFLGVAERIRALVEEAPVEPGSTKPSLPQSTPRGIVAAQREPGKKPGVLPAGGKATKVPSTSAQRRGHL